MTLKLDIFCLLPIDDSNAFLSIIQNNGRGLQIITVLRKLKFKRLKKGFLLHTSFK